MTASTVSRAVDRPTSPLEILVPAQKTGCDRFHAPDQELTTSTIAKSATRHASVVDRHTVRTTAVHGITGAELERLNGALHFMERHCSPLRSDLWWLSTNRGMSRTDIADIWKRITKLHGTCGLLKYSMLTFETGGGRHAHIIFLGTAGIAGRLRDSKFGAVIKIAPVDDPSGLVQNYLAKERTPQAGYRRAHLLGGRLKGSHRLDGGGDRVRLSRDLERDGIEAGAVEPWQHTNAKRSDTRGRGSLAPGA